MSSARCLNPIPTGGVGERDAIVEQDRPSLNPIPTGGVGEHAAQYEPIFGPAVSIPSPPAGWVNVREVLVGVACLNPIPTGGVGERPGFALRGQQHGVSIPSPPAGWVNSA